jgi:hypothetical protein
VDYQGHAVRGCRSLDQREAKVSSEGKAVGSTCEPHEAYRGLRAGGQPLDEDTHEFSEYDDFLCPKFRPETPPSTGSLLHRVSES